MSMSGHNPYLILPEWKKTMTEEHEGEFLTWLHFGEWYLLQNQTHFHLNFELVCPLYGTWP